MSATTLEKLQRENEELRRRLEESEAIVLAISKHEVDAFVVDQSGEDRILVLDGVDRPYRLLIERMQQGAAVLSQDGVFIYGNRRLSEMLALPTTTFAGKRVEDQIDARDRAAFTTLLQQGAGGDAQCELALQRSDGSSFPALLNVSPLVGLNSVLCLVVTDLTQQKRHEIERQRFIQEQAARNEAERMTEFLRASDRRKDEFLATLAHELRNPLAPLRNGLQILNLIGSREPAARQAHEMMGRQLESLIRLVDDLLDAGRVTQGKIQLRKERTDLKAVVKRALETTRSFIEAHGHRLGLKLPESEVPVDADLVRMTQVVTNLLNNAAKFTPRGGHIWLTVETQPHLGQAVLRVQDNGRGIAPEMLAGIFELFAQADPSAARTEGGLGIGLTLARRLVEMHNGTLNATSDGVGKGSEFIVRLPLAPGPDSGDAQHATSGAGSSLSKLPAKRILVVDDNRDSAHSLSTLLRLIGHDVREAHDGTRAVEIMADFVPDLLLLDIGLPGMTGHDVARHVRSDARLREAYVVAISGYGTDEDLARSHAAGFDTHLIKPVDFSALETLLESLDAKKRR